MSHIASCLSRAPPAFKVNHHGEREAPSGSGEKDRQQFWTLSHLSYMSLHLSLGRQRVCRQCEKMLIKVSAGQIGSSAETLRSRGPEFFHPPTLDLREVSGDRVHEVEHAGFKPASSGSCLTDSGELVLKHLLPKRAATTTANL